jgi:hypothetical protein
VTQVVAGGMVRKSRRPLAIPTKPAAEKHIHKQKNTNSSLNLNEIAEGKKQLQAKHFKSRKHYVSSGQQKTKQQTPH